MGRQLLCPSRWGRFRKTDAATCLLDLTPRTQLRLVAALADARSSMCDILTAVDASAEALAASGNASIAGGPKVFDMRCLLERVARAMGTRDYR